MPSHQDDEDDDDLANSSTTTATAPIRDRPNAWRGSASHWKKLVSNEIDLQRALQLLQTQDLSLHLYNAFKISQTYDPPRGPPPSRGGKVDKRKNTNTWKPRPSWSYWPLARHVVPPAEFLERTAEDLYDKFTFRREEKRWIGQELEEIVIGLILKEATERLRARGIRASFGVEEQKPVDEMDGDDASANKDEAEQDEEHTTDWSEADEAYLGRDTEHKKRRTPAPGYRPVISADDETSYKLLRPKTRGILAKVDATLAILHTALVGNLPSVKPPSGTASNAASRAVSPLNESLSTAQASPTLSRPPSAALSEADEDVDVDSTAKSTPGVIKKQSKATTSKVEAGRGETGTEETRERHLRELNKRDWSDVLSAAALAQFAPAVLARATQRCADLFGQGMDMINIQDGLVDTGGSGRNTDEDKRPHIAFDSERYQPALPPFLTEPIFEAPLGRGRWIYRRQKVPYNIPEQVEADEEPDTETQQITKFTCPHTDCKRHTRPYARLHLYRQHLLTKHGETAYDHHNMPSKRTLKVHQDESLGMTQSTQRRRAIMNPPKYIRPSRRKSTTEAAGSQDAEIGDGTDTNKKAAANEQGAHTEPSIQQPTEVQPGPCEPRPPRTQTTLSREAAVIEYGIHRDGFLRTIETSRRRHRDDRHGIQRPRLYAPHAARESSHDVAEGDEAEDEGDAMDVDAVEDQVAYDEGTGQAEEGYTE